MYSAQPLPSNRPASLDTVRASNRRWTFWGDSPEFLASAQCRQHPRAGQAAGPMERPVGHMQGLALGPALNMQLEAPVVWWFGPQAVVAPEPGPRVSQLPSHSMSDQEDTPASYLLLKGQGSFPWAGQFTPQTSTPSPLDGR